MPSPRGSSDRRILAGLGLIGAAAGILSLIVNVAAGARVGAGQGCVSDDESSYCAMALGHLGAPPFNRRPLAPGLVRLMHFGSVADRFLLLDAVSILAAVVLTGYLAARVAAEMGAPPERTRAAGLAGGGLVAALPYMLHLLWYSPDRTDYLSFALSAAFVACLTARRFAAAAAAPVLAALMVATREQALLGVIMMAALAMVVRRRVLWAELSAVAAVVMVAVDVNLPSAGADQASRQLLAQYTRMKFSSGAQLMAVGHDLVMAGAVMAVAALVHHRALIDRTKGSSLAHFLVGGMVLNVGVNLAWGLVGGFNTVRIASEAAPFAVALAVGASTATGRYTVLVGGAAGSLLAWRPWAVLDASHGPWALLVSPQSIPQLAPHVLGQTLYLLAVPVLAVVVWRRLRAGAEAAPARPAGAAGIHPRPPGLD